MNMWEVCICKNKVKVNDNSHSFGICDKCKLQGWIIDGYLIPWPTRDLLCNSTYTGVNNLNVSKYKQNDIIKLKGIKSTKYEMYKVKYVYHEKNIMIVFNSKKEKLLIDSSYVKKAYKELYNENKIMYSNWWNKIVNIIE